MKSKEAPEAVRDATARFIAEIRERFPDVAVATRFNPIPHVDSGVTARCSSQKERARVMKRGIRLAVRYYMREGVFIEPWAYLPGEYPWPHHFPEETEPEQSAAPAGRDTQHFPGS